jgi:hypothetical protein
LYVSAKILPKSANDAMRGYDIDGKKMNEIRMTKLEGMEGLRHAKPLKRKS